jgi:hypothetical protein
MLALSFLRLPAVLSEFMYSAKASPETPGRADVVLVTSCF